MDETDPRIFLEDVGTSPLALFQEIRAVGHVYRISPDEPIASLQIASEAIEVQFGPAPQRIRLSAETFQEIRETIREKTTRR